MPETTPDAHPGPGAGATAGAACFRTTHWSVVLAADQSGSTEADAAMESLCRTYWYPIYAYVRRQGHSAHDAQDLTQDFFARFLAKNYMQRADPSRGRFRAFLLKSLTHFLVNDWERTHAQKRGGGRQVIPLDEVVADGLFQQEPSTGASPEALFDKKWAMTLLERAMVRLGSEYAAAGKREVFDGLKGLLLAENSVEAYRRLSSPLGMSEGAVKVAVHRLRQRFREAVRAEIEETVATPEEVDGELRCLMMAISG